MTPTEIENITLNRATIVKKIHNVQEFLNGADYLNATHFIRSFCVSTRLEKKFHDIIVVVLCSEYECFLVLLFD